MKTEFDTRKVCGALARDHSTKKLWEHNAMNLKQEGTNMNNQAKDSLENATARPWEMNKSEHPANSPKVAVYAWEKDKMKKVGDLTSFSMNDRALIVRAVNAYDSLVEALESAQLKLQKLHQWDASDEIESVLSLAKGA